LKEEKSEELDYLSGLIGEKVTRDNIYSYVSQIKDLLYQCYKGKKDKDTRIKWIVHGYIFGKNRRLEDWFPSVNSRFTEYDELLNKGIVDNTTIRFNQYDKKNLNGGLIQLEDTLKKYNVDTKNYKVYDKATDRDIDFSEYRDDLHPDLSYVYRDPNTDEKLLTVIAPRSVYSAVYWGWDTKWCTARIDKGENNIFKNNMFSKYYKNNDINRLYILQYRNIKYQLHFGSSQFMDVDDKPVVLDYTERTLFSKWIEHFVAEKSNSTLYTILKFCIRFEVHYPLDIELTYPDSRQIQIQYKNGICKEWYENGQIREETTYVDGKRHGMYKWWYENGQIRIETTYVDGKRHGSYKWWYENGQIKIEITYVDGKRHGSYKWWYENGQIKNEATYVDKKMNGVNKSWYPNGQMEMETTYVDNKLHGGYKWWYENGQIGEETTYVDGKRHGGYKEWHENGQIREEATYVDDNKIKNK
jgi:antitoxin component YwqK of YwqJK toxin-antitoxin module